MMCVMLEDYAPLAWHASFSEKMINVKKRVNRFFTSNTFVLTKEGEKKVWLVDCGDTDKVLEMLPEGHSVEGVLFTHAHADHIYGINELLEVFPEVKIITNAFGKEALVDPKLNITRYHEELPDLVLTRPENVVVMGEGDTIELYEGVKAKVYETLGHDLSCLTYKIENKIFTGDSHIPGIKVVAKFPKSNKKMAVASEQRIIELAKGLEIYPGHTINLI